MKQITFFRHTVLCTLAVSMFSLTSCSDKENAFDSESLKDLEAFTFDTSSKVDLSVNLGSAAAKQVIAVYPTEVDVISANMHYDMLYSAFTDEYGNLDTDIKIPAAIDKVWMVSLTKPDLGVMTADVVDGKIVVSNISGTRAVTDSNTTEDSDGNITTVQSDGSSLTLYNIDDYVTVHEGTITGQHASQGYKTLSNVSKSDMGTFWCIDKWMPSSDITSPYRYGKTDDTNGLKSTNEKMAEYSGDLHTNETNWVKNNYTTIANYDASQINQHMTGETTVVENADGSTTTTTYTGSELWVTFIKEQAAYQNTFGYYIYKTDNPPTTEAEGYALERIVLWPNIAIQSHDPYKRGSRQTADLTSNDYTIYTQDAPLTVGERTQLLFKDPETGAISKIFPPGYSVGFWFCADAHDPGWNTNGSSCKGLKMDYTNSLIFTQNNKRYDPWRWNKSGERYNINSYFGNSNPDLNNSSLIISNKYKSRFVQYDTTLYGEEFTLYAIEDGGDTSFNDMLFAVSRKDNTEVTNSNSDVKLYSEKKYHTVATYAFEDQWPTGGDFDMNDVIIEHDQLQTYTEDNYVHSVRDKFTLSPESKAIHQNAFYVQFPEGQEGNVANLKVTVDGVEMPNRWEAETNSVIVFTDQVEAKNTGKTTVIVTRDLSGTQYEVGHLEYHPYLIANAIVDDVTYVGAGRTEIHIPGDDITSLGKTLTVVKGTINTNYYASQFVSDNNEFPFAFSLSNVKDWIAPDEGIRIDKTFKKYASWRAASGFKDTDWYYNKSGYDVRK